MSEKICPMCGDECEGLHQTKECGEVCQFCVNDEDLTCYDPDRIREEMIKEIK